MSCHNNDLNVSLRLGTAGDLTQEVFVSPCGECDTSRQLFLGTQSKHGQNRNKSIATQIKIIFKDEVCDFCATR